MLLHMNRIINQMVVTSDGQNIGEVKDLYFDDKHWTIRYFVVNTGAWHSNNLVLVSPFSIVNIEPFSFQIQTNLTRAQLEHAPSIDCAKPISRLEEEKYSQYFGLPFYWASTTEVWPLGYFPMQNVTKSEDVALDIKSSDSSHLRSYKAVIGHKIKARDDEFGNVEELIIEEESFTIRFLLINTISFWPSKSVLISPKWIDEISWHEKVFVTQLTKDAIKSSPPYDPGNPIDRIYENKLYEFYNVTPYWNIKSESEEKVEGWIPGIQDEIAKNHKASQSNPQA